MHYVFFSYLHAYTFFFFFLGLVKVSRVEIGLVMNNTEFSADGVGIDSNEFRASIIFPTRAGMSFYRLDIYTCDRVNTKSQLNSEPEMPDIGDLVELIQLPFYITQRPSI